MNRVSTPAEWTAASQGWSGAQGSRSTQGQGSWVTTDDRATLRAEPGADWNELALPPEASAAYWGAPETSLEVTVSGKAIAAGVAFGPNGNFLTTLPLGSWSRRISVESHDGGKAWTFLVDGRPSPPWGSLPLLADEHSRAISLKVFGGVDVEFGDMAIRRFEAPCTLSIVIVCHRFVQRLRLALLAWCLQSAPSGSYEIIVVNPRSPDGTSEHLAAVSAAFPGVRVRELFVDGPAEKPNLINRAVQECRGDWVWLTDADCLFSTNAVQLVLDEIEKDPADLSRLLYATRRHLRRSDTDALLAMALDAVVDFAELADRAEGPKSQAYPWGYTQIVPRGLLQQVPYREDMRHFAHSDGIFVDACKERGVAMVAVDGLVALHLVHPFAWYGTDAYL